MTFLCEFMDGMSCPRALLHVCGTCGLGWPFQVYGRTHSRHWLRCERAHVRLAECGTDLAFVHTGPMWREPHCRRNPPHRRPCKAALLACLPGS